MVGFVSVSHRKSAIAAWAGVNAGEEVGDELSSRVKAKQPSVEKNSYNITALQSPSLHVQACALHLATVQAPKATFASSRAAQPGTLESGPKEEDVHQAHQTISSLLADFNQGDNSPTGQQKGSPTRVGKEQAQLRSSTDALDNPSNPTRAENTGSVVNQQLPGTARKRGIGQVSAEQPASIETYSGEACLCAPGKTSEHT